jgi:hypothetical protein
VAFVGLWAALLGYYPTGGMPTGLLVWWSVLCAISVLNLVAWQQSAVMLARQQPQADVEGYRLQRWQLALSAAFVFGCAFRSLLPRGDVQRIGLFDTWISSVLVGRSVATVAELCFAAQWAVWLRQAARKAESPVALAIAWLLVPLIVVAEVCSWYAVLTTAYIGNMIEESLWAVSAALIIIAGVALWRRSRSALPAYPAAIVLFGTAYFLYMCLVDVPMYATRWQEDEANGRAYLSLDQGLWDVGSRWKVTHSWEQWSEEIPWMSLYFSLGVWASLTLVHVPRPDVHFPVRRPRLPGW